MAETMAEC